MNARTAVSNKLRAGSRGDQAQNKKGKNQAAKRCGHFIISGKVMIVPPL
jgi:hypothetical protein